MYFLSELESHKERTEYDYRFKLRKIKTHEEIRTDYFSVESRVGYPQESSFVGITVRIPFFWSMYYFCVCNKLRILGDVDVALKQVWFLTTDLLCKENILGPHLTRQNVD